MGKKTPFYRRGKSNHYPPTSHAQSGTTPWAGRYCRADEENRALTPERYYRGSTGGTTAWSSTTAATSVATFAPDQKLVTSLVVVGTDVFF